MHSVINSARHQLLPPIVLIGQALILFCLLAVPAILIGSYDEIVFRKNVLPDSPLYQLLWTFDLGSQVLWFLDFFATAAFLFVGLSQLKSWSNSDRDCEKQPDTQ